MQEIGIDELDNKIRAIITAEPGIRASKLIQKFPSESERKMYCRIKTLARDGWIRAVKTRGIVNCYPVGTVKQA